jgi:hypothetical protein
LRLFRPFLESRSRFRNKSEKGASLRSDSASILLFFFAAVLMVLSGGSVAVVGSWLPGGGGYGFVAVAGRLVRDGFEGLAARHPAMTRPLIERRDMIAG